MLKYQPSKLFSLSAFGCMKYNRDFYAAHPDYFFPEGTTVFCGAQGCGKTISAVRMVQNVVKLFPHCIVCSNIDFNSLPDFKGEYYPYSDLDDLIKLQNGYEGVLYVLDEMHLLFNSLQSKDMPLEVFQEVSQQRKQRKCIIGTSQVFMRLAKPFREQISNVVLCNTLFKYLQCNYFVDGTTATEVDGHLEATCYGSRYFWHSPELFASYDTYAKIKAGQGFSQAHYNFPDNSSVTVSAGRSGKRRNFGRTY